jgi:hypothetical protein
MKNSFFLFKFFEELDIAKANQSSVLFLDWSWFNAPNDHGAIQTSRVEYCMRLSEFERSYSS